MLYILPKERSYSGYSLLEMMLALMIVSVSTMAITPLLKTVIKLYQLQKYDYQRDIAIYQLQITLAANDIIEIKDDEIIYQNARNEYTLHIVNNKLIAQPGTLIYIYGIEEVYFWEEKGIVYVQLDNDEDQIYPIAYEK